MLLNKSLALSRNNLWKESTVTGKNLHFSELKKRFSFVWTIKEFLRCPHKTGECLTSSIFPDGSNEAYKWALKLYPYGFTKDCGNYISLFLSLDECAESDVKVEFILAVLNKDEQKINLYHSVKTTAFDPGISLGCNRFIERKSLIDKGSDLLANGNLRIYCEVSVEAVNVWGQASSAMCKTPKYDISANFGRLLENPIFSDVTLNINGREILAHKAILSAHSPVFSAMFRQERMKSSHTTVHITDIPYEIMKDVLHFIYTGRTPNIQTITYHLLSAADKYALEHLKGLCEKELALTISVERAAYLLFLADKYKANNLKCFIIDFISEHCVSVSSTEGWRNLIQIAPHLIHEAYFELTKRINPLVKLCGKIEKPDFN